MRKLLLAFALGGLQGLLGWIMVKSGLVDVPWVSPYRLTAHLLLALFLYVYLLYLTLEVFAPQQKDSVHIPISRKLMKIIIALLGIQLFYGGLMSGLKAAYFFPAFPTMNGQWIPEGLFAYVPWWSNWFENPATVQFIHRTNAYLLTIVTAFTWIRSGKFSSGKAFKLSLYLMGITLIIQILLGILTLISSHGWIPLIPAVAHQAGALLFITAVALVYFQLKK